MSQLYSREINLSRRSEVDRKDQVWRSFIWLRWGSGTVAWPALKLAWTQAASAIWCMSIRQGFERTLTCAHAHCTLIHYACKHHFLISFLKHSGGALVVFWARQNLHYCLIIYQFQCCRFQGLAEGVGADVRVGEGSNGPSKVRLHVIEMASFPALILSFRLSKTMTWQ